MFGNKQIIQAVEFQKAVSENSFDLLQSIQNQGQQMMEMVIDNTSFFPERMEQIYSGWADFMKQNGESCRVYVRNSLDGFKELVAKEPIPTPPAKSKSAKKSG